MRDRVDRGAVRALAIALVAATAGCVTNPYTGRSQLMLMSVDEESKLGAQAYAEVQHDPHNTVSHDPRETEPVNRVAQRIIEAAKVSKYAEVARQFQWEVTVLKADKTMNAFALPGGKIAVYTGIFPAAKNEAGLAAILGHEVTHALARHGAERMSQSTVAQWGLTAANVALQTSGAGAGTSALAMAALGAGTQVGVLLPFSREHESEADYVGLLLAAQAGYDPHEAIHVWERMERFSSGEPAEFLSTHPGHETRIRQLQGWMDEALKLYVPRPDSDRELPPISG